MAARERAPKPMRHEDEAAHEYTQTWCKGTVRTQLGHFQRVVPRITDAFTVHA